MRIFGLTITRAKPAQVLQPVNDHGYSSGRGGWWPLIVRDHYPGAWQRNDEIRVDTVLAYSAVFACVTMIASDIGKLRLRLVELTESGIWQEVDVPAFSPVLRKPNHYQTRVKFVEQWITSKLVHGNTYALKQRDDRNVVTALYILDPTRVQPLIAPNGDVYYRLHRGDWSNWSLVPNFVDDDQDLIVPAKEIIHDLMVPLYHPLIGVSPIYACGLAALQGLKIQDNSLAFFANGSKPGGILTAPGAIEDETAKRLKDHWDNNYSGANAGKVAVLGDGLKYESMAVNAVDSQLVEQLKWSAETVCSCFHIPPYMIGVGPAPTYNNIEALNQMYYSRCLQSLIENFEASMDEGLALPKPLGTEFDLEGLLRMDTAAKVKAAADAIKGGYLAPNEARKSFDLAPVTGGDTPYMQQQNFSLAALDKRDKDDPFSKPPAAALPAPEPDEEEEPSEEEVEEETNAMLSLFDRIANDGLEKAA